MVDLERLGAGAPVLPGGDEAGRPRQRAAGVHDNGMGDLLRYDAERLRILVERHHLHTGSERARELLENWDAALPRFVKVMPQDYRRALLDMEAERNAASTVAAE
jgi:glutamate synthase (NADPH/NADH) large chain